MRRMEKFHLERSSVRHVDLKMMGCLAMTSYEAGGGNAWLDLLEGSDGGCELAAYQKM